MKLDKHELENMREWMQTQTEFIVATKEELRKDLLSEKWFILGGSPLLLEKLYRNVYPNAKVCPCVNLEGELTTIFWFKKTLEMKTLFDKTDLKFEHLISAWLAKYDEPLAFVKCQYTTPKGVEFAVERIMRSYSNDSEILRQKNV